VIGPEAAYIIFGLQFEEIVELVASDVDRIRHSERVEQLLRRVRALLAGRGKVELDPLAFLARFEQSAPGVKPRFALQGLLLPERVRAGQRRMTAQIDFGRRREPSQRKVAVARKQKRRLGEVHLRGDVLHPLRIALTVEQTDSRGIALERLAGERLVADDGAVERDDRRHALDDELVQSAAGALERLGPGGAEKEPARRAPRPEREPPEPPDESPWLMRGTFLLIPLLFLGCWILTYRTLQPAERS